MPRKEHHILGDGEGMFVRYIVSSGEIMTTTVGTVYISLVNLKEISKSLISGSLLTYTNINGQLLLI